MSYKRGNFPLGANLKGEVTKIIDEPKERDRVMYSMIFSTNKSAKICLNFRSSIGDYWKKYVRLGETYYVSFNMDVVEWKISSSLDTLYELIFDERSDLTISTSEKTESTASTPVIVTRSINHSSSSSYQSPQPISQSSLTSPSLAPSQPTYRHSRDVTPNPPSPRQSSSYRSSSRPILRSNTPQTRSWSALPTECRTMNVDELRIYIKDILKQHRNIEKDMYETIAILANELDESYVEIDVLNDIISKLDPSGKSLDNKPLLFKSKRSSILNPSQSVYSYSSTPQSEEYRKSMVYGYKTPGQNVTVRESFRSDKKVAVIDQTSAIELQRAKDENLRLFEESKELRKKLLLAEEQVVNLRLELNNSHSSLQKSRIELSADNDTLLTQMEDYKSNINHLEAVIKELEIRAISYKDTIKLTEEQLEKERSKDTIIAKLKNDMRLINNTNSSLQQDVQLLKDENGALKKIIDELRDVGEPNERRLSISNDSEYIKYEIERKEIERAIEPYERDNSEITKKTIPERIRHCVTNYNALKKEVSTNKLKINTLETTIGDYNNRLSTYEINHADHDSYQSRIDRLETLIRELKTDIIEKQQIINNLKEKEQQNLLSSNDKRLKEMSNDLKKLENLIEEEKIENEKLTRENDSLKNKIPKLEDKIKDLTNKNSQLDDTIYKYETHGNQNNNELSAKQIELKTLKTKITQLEKANEKLSQELDDLMAKDQSEISKLTNENLNLKKQLHMYQLNLSKAEEENKQLKTLNDELNKLNNKILEDKKQKEKEYTEKLALKDNLHAPKMKLLESTLDKTNDLAKDNDDLRSKVKINEEQNNILNKKVESLQLYCDELIDQLKSGEQERDKQFKSFAEERKRLQNKNQELNNRIIELESKNNTLESDNEQLAKLLKEKTKKYEDKIIELNSIIDELRNDNKKLNNDMSKLNTNYNLLNDSCQSRINKVNEEKELLDGKINNLNLQLNEAIDDKNNKDNELNELKLINYNLSADILSANKKLNDLQKNYEAQIQKNESEKLKLLDLNNDQQQVISKLKDDISKKEDEIRKLNSEITDLIDEKNKSGQINSELEAIKKKYKDQISELEQQNNDEIKSLKNQIDGLKKSVILKENEISELNNKNDIQDIENKEKQRIMEENNKKLSNLLDSVRKNNQELSDQNVDLDRQIIDLNSQIEKLNKTIKDKNRLIDELNLKIDKLNEEFDNIENDTKDIKKQNNILSDEKKKFLEELKNKDDELNDKLNVISMMELDTLNNGKSLKKLTESIKQKEEEKLIELEDKENQVQELENNLNRLNNRNKQLETDNIELKNQIENLNTDIDSKIGEIDDVKKQLNDANNEVNKLRNQLKDNTQAKKIIDDLQESINDKEDEIDAKNKQINNLKQNLEKLEKEKSDKENLINELNVEIKNIEANNENDMKKLINDNELNKKKIKKLELSNNDLDNKVNEINELIEEKLEMIKSRDRDIVSLKSKNDELNKQINDYKDFIKNNDSVAKDQYDEMQTKCKQKDKLIKELNNELEKLKPLYNDEKLLNDELHKNLENVKSELNKSEKERRDLIKQKNGKSDELEQIYKILQDRDIINSNLVKQLDQLTDETNEKDKIKTDKINSLQKLINEMEDKIDDLQSQIPQESLIKENVNLKQSLLNQQSLIDEYSSQIQRKSSVIEKPVSNDKYKRLLKEKNELEQINNELTQKVNITTNVYDERIAKLNDKIQQLTQDLALMTAKNAQLQNQIKSSNDTNNSSNKESTYVYKESIIKSENLHGGTPIEFQQTILLLNNDLFKVENLYNDLIGDYNRLTRELDRKMSYWRNSIDKMYLIDMNKYRRLKREIIASNLNRSLFPSLSARSEILPTTTVRDSVVTTTTTRKNLSTIDKSSDYSKHY